MTANRTLLDVVDGPELLFTGMAIAAAQFTQT
jgi:hypothetical protein